MPAYGAGPYGGGPTGGPLQTIIPSGIASANAWGTLVFVRGPVTISPSGIASASAWGTLVLSRGPVSIAPSGISPAAIFGAVTIIRRGLPQTLAPNGIPSGTLFGTTVVILGGHISPTGIPPGNVFGVTVIHGGSAHIIHPTGIPSAEAWWKRQATVVQRLRTTTAVLTPSGIVTAEVWGHPTIAPQAVYIIPIGIAGAEAFGIEGLGKPFIIPAPTGTGPLALMLVRRMGVRH